MKKITREKETQERQAIQARQARKDRQDRQERQVTQATQATQGTPSTPVSKQTRKKRERTTHSVPTAVQRKATRLIDLKRQKKGSLATLIDLKRHKEGSLTTRLNSRSSTETSKDAAWSFPVLSRLLESSKKARRPRTTKRFPNREKRKSLVPPSLQGNSHSRVLKSTRKSQGISHKKQHKVVQGISTSKSLRNALMRNGAKSKYQSLVRKGACCVKDYNHKQSKKDKR